MPTFTFALLVSGVDDTDETHVEALIAHDEVVLVSSTDGRTHVDLAVDAITPGASVRRGVHLIELAVPGAIVRAVDLDLVGATEIAQRAGVSRQAVNQWVAGGGGRAFPSPLGHLSGGTRVWAWSAVVPWLQNVGRALDESSLPYASVVEANALLVRTRQPGRLATAGEWHRPELRTAGRRATVSRSPVRVVDDRSIVRIGDGPARAA